MKENLHDVKEDFMELLTGLVDPAPEEHEKIESLLIELGVNKFFQGIEYHDLSIAVKDKLKALRNVIRAFQFDEADKHILKRGDL